ncbi:MAG: hypothetical protein KDJ17_04260 [Hyphomicrobiaceae bacterium]|nr:hypothetical protein [Hyphomicrobiaceae bacterium]
MKNFAFTMVLAAAAACCIPALANAHGTKKAPSASSMVGFGRCAKGPCTRRANFGQQDAFADERASTRRTRGRKQEQLTD